jgi:hypothetical protein
MGLLYQHLKEGMMEREGVVRYHPGMRLDGMRRSVHARGEAVSSLPQKRN